MQKIMIGASSTFKRNIFLAVGLWPLFFIFTAVNALLAYTTISLEMKIWIGLFGWALPFFSVLISVLSRKPDAVVSFSKEFLSPISSLFWWCLILAAVLARFAFLTDFHGLPIYDEAMNSFYSIQLLRHWTWYPFFHSCQLPPLYIWFQAAVFKIFGVSLSTLWTFPALLSLVSVAFFWLASRRLLSASISFVFAVLLSLSFWPIFIGRFAHQVNFMLVTEGIAFFLLGILTVSPSAATCRNVSLLLGFVIGLGLYTYFAWPLVALLVGSTLVWWVLKGSYKAKYFFWFLTSFFLTFTPLLIAMLLKGYGSYYSTLLISHSNPDNLEEWNFSQSLLYFTSFFWESWKKTFAYNPWWGGFLNPILGSAFFLGTIELLRLRQSGFSRWLAWAFMVLFIPILFANNTNWFHVAPLLPLFLVVIAVGIRALWLCSSKFWTRWIFLFLLLFSSLLDVINVEKTRSWIYRTNFSLDTAKAYQYLLDQSRQKGPGLIFCHFRPNLLDVSLSVLTYDFNTCENNKYDPALATWCALITLQQDEHQLSRVFSEIQFLQLNSDINSPESSPILAIFPMKKDNQREIHKWLEADDLFDWVVYEQLSRVPNRSRLDLIQKMESNYPLFQSEPLLAFYFWRTQSFIYNKQKNYPAAFAAQIRALQHNPNPIAMDYYQAGKAAFNCENYSMAKKYYLEAGKKHASFVPPSDFLQKLEQMENLVQTHDQSDLSFYPK